MTDVQEMTGTGQPPSGDVRPGGSATGRMALIGGAVFALLIVAVLVGAFVAVFFLGGGETGAPAAPPKTTAPAVPASMGATGTSQAETESAPSGADLVGNKDVFKFRDIFAALIKPKPAVTASSSADASSTAGSTDTSGSAGTSQTPDPDVLVLQDIVVDNGVRKAVLAFGGVTYTSAEGERLGSTPWQVLDVGSSSVTMLYGDSQVTLTVGQGIQK